jgi:hypothetical protein
VASRPLRSSHALLGLVTGLACSSLQKPFEYLVQFIIYMAQVKALQDGNKRAGRRSEKNCHYMLEFVLFLREPYSLREAFFTDHPPLLHSCPGGVASVQVFAQAPMRDKRGSGEMNLCSEADPAQAAALHKVCARHSTQQLGSNTPAGKSLVRTDEAPVVLRSCRPSPFARPHPLSPFLSP